LFPRKRSMRKSFRPSYPDTGSLGQNLVRHPLTAVRTCCYALCETLSNMLTGQNSPRIRVASGVRVCVLLSGLEGNLH
jgi:hypothetical protein